MMEEWKSILTGAGIGSFLGFIVAVALYSTLNNDGSVYLIYVGMLIGALLGIRYRIKVNASAYSFPFGFQPSK